MTVNVLGTQWSSSGISGGKPSDSKPVRFWFVCVQFRRQDGPRLDWRQSNVDASGSALDDGARHTFLGRSWPAMPIRAGKVRQDDRTSFTAATAFAETGIGLQRAGMEGHNQADHDWLLWPPLSSSLSLLFSPLPPPTPFSFELSSQHRSSVAVEISLFSVSCLATNIMSDNSTSPAVSTDSVNCANGGGAHTYTGLRIASVFIIWFGSTFGALFPVLARRAKWLSVPTWVFDFAKYFGSGVIIATAFIHLLSPALSELTSPCLASGWQDYPYALALALLSIFSIFIVELLAFRIGTAKLRKLGITHDAHGHGVGAHSAHGPEGSQLGPAGGEEVAKKENDTVSEADIENQHKHDDDASALAQIIGVAILEFGVMLHSILIGLTLAVDESFKILFVVIIFHQLFEGLGIGSRLAFLDMPRKYSFVPVVAALLYGITTPIGIAAGLGIRTTYNPGTARASIVSGVLDALSAGILIYTGLVELLAHEFLFNKEMHEASNAKLVYAIGCMLLGCGIMALLGRWA
ncbi:hypothetical protein EW146_g8287 [Bondarzewia mesenterica]|uniref:ZIP-like iron-zinc transporter n=1 Tax=Bondarzewia mesenterica TaxID=1095465 RepID=A0A4S4LFL9_9AGAM|nr:hypothetical protein EW146_g8287 [Bondarzewia mesenterica]